VAKITTLEMEIAVAQYFNPRVNLTVPNVSWGLNLYEIDLLVLTKNNYAYEVELKISRADLKRDLQKRHGHRSYDPDNPRKDGKISRLYFAIPDYLQCSADLIPGHAGILVVGNELSDTTVQCVRNPKINHSYQWSDAQRLALLRLGAMRIWTLKKQLWRARINGGMEKKQPYSPLGEKG